MEIRKNVIFILSLLVSIFFISSVCLADDITIDEDCLWLQWVTEDYPEGSIPGGFENFHYPPTWSSINFSRVYGNLRMSVRITSYAIDDLAVAEFEKQQANYRGSVGTTCDIWFPYTCNTVSIVQDEEFSIARWSDRWYTMGGYAYYRGAVLSAYTAACDDGQDMHSSNCDDTKIPMATNLAALKAIMDEARALIDQKCGPVRRIPSSLEMDSPIETLDPDNESQAVITLLVKDQFGDPMSGQPVSFTAPVLGSLSPSSGDTDPDGIFSATYTAPSLAELGQEKYIDIVAGHDTEDLAKSLRFFFDLPNNDPALVDVAIAPETIAADGLSTAEILVTLTNTAGYLLSGEVIALDLPEVGSLSPLSGITREDGTFKATYTVPEFADVAGHNFIDITARHTESNLTGSARVDFILASLDVTSEPSDPVLSLDAAIIPGDSRFPAKYHLVLRDPKGALLSNLPLTVSIENSAIARLDGGGSSGSQIILTTNDQGQALVEYTYLGDPPEGEVPFVDTIAVRNQNLGLEKLLYVSIGLDIQVITLTKAIEGNQGSFPKTLGMRFQIQDAYRPTMNLFTYLTDLEQVSGNRVGMNLEIQWLNKPSPRFMDTVRMFFPNLANPPEPLLYNGNGVVSIGDTSLSEIIIEALAQPSLSMGPNIFPAITFAAPGNYWFRTVAVPVVLPAAGSDVTEKDLVSGAALWETGPIFSADILDGSESLLKSLTCMFKPTSKQQFVAKSLFLDNPLLTGLSVAGGIPFAVIAVTKVSGILCDYLSGDYFTAMANLVSLDIEMRETLVEKGIWDLTQAQQAQMARAHLLNFYWANWSAGNDSWTQFSVASPTQKAGSRAFLADSGEPVELWPEALGFEEFLDLVAQAMAGALASHDYFKGLDFIAVLGGDTAPILSNQSANAISAGGDGVTVFLCPSGTGDLFVSGTGDLKIYHHQSNVPGSVTISAYSIAGNGENTGYSLDLAGDKMLLVDQGMDGSVDASILPILTTHSFLAGDINDDEIVDMKDIILALQILTGMDETVITPDVISHFADMDGDGKIGRLEAMVILQKISNLK